TCLDGSVMKGDVENRGKPPNRKGQRRPAIYRFDTAPELLPLPSGEGGPKGRMRVVYLSTFDIRPFGLSPWTCARDSCTPRVRSRALAGPSTSPLRSYAQGERN